MEEGDLGAHQEIHCRSARNQLLSAETGESEGAPAASERAFYAGIDFLSIMKCPEEK